MTNNKRLTVLMHFYKKPQTSRLLDSKLMIHFPEALFSEIDSGTA